MVRQISKFDGNRLSVGKLFKKIGFEAEVVEISVVQEGSDFVIVKIRRMR
jgi:hypothetical protein